jgi:hypothetical protein
VDSAAEHLGARPYMTRLVRAEKVGYFETPSANPVLQRRDASALLTVQPDISMRQGAHYVMLGVNNKDGLQAGGYVSSWITNLQHFYPLACRRPPKFVAIR